MTNQKRTIMGACEFSIATLQELRKDLLEIGAANSETRWAIGGVVITLAAHLLQICDQVFAESCAAGDPSAKQDLTEIQTRFNDFIDRMVNHE